MITQQKNNNNFNKNTNEIDLSSYVVSNYSSSIQDTCAEERSENNISSHREKEIVCKTIQSFKFYRVYVEKKKNHIEETFKSLPSSHQNYLSSFDEYIKNLDTANKVNADFIDKVLHSSSFSHFGLSDEETNSCLDMHPGHRKYGLSISDLDKVRTVFKQFVRDWSRNGEKERKSSYSPIFSSIKKLFPKNKCNPQKIDILVPGAGLGRLAWEIGMMGYNCQGNEFSLYMLIPSYFILNTCEKIGEYEIYPWIAQTRNISKRNEQFESVRIPDVDPTMIQEKCKNFSMAAGDFLEIYTELDRWDCIPTVFFIDTAHNIIDYMECIYKILKPGGYWINLGPLLYHFSDMNEEVSIDLSYEEVIEVAKKIGFTILEERERLSCTYTQNPHSMLLYEYKCMFNIFQKPTSVSR